MEREEKRAFVANLETALSSVDVVVVAQYSGLSVGKMTDLRGQTRDAGGKIRVAKNRLVKRAIADTPLDHMTPLFKGPTLLMYSQDPIVAPKTAAAFEKQNAGFVILGGALGNTALDAAAVKSLAELPSLDELRARLAGMMAQPATRVAQIMGAPGAQLARLFNNYSEKETAA